MNKTTNKPFLSRSFSGTVIHYNPRTIPIFQQLEFNQNEHMRTQWLPIVSSRSQENRNNQYISLPPVGSANLVAKKKKKINK